MVILNYQKMRTTAICAADGVNSEKQQILICELLFDLITLQFGKINVISL